jgi:hypothetical protein
MRLSRIVVRNSEILLDDVEDRHIRNRAAVGQAATLKIADLSIRACVPSVWAFSGGAGRDYRSPHRGDFCEAAGNIAAVMTRL